MTRPIPAARDSGERKRMKIPNTEVMAAVLTATVGLVATLWAVVWQGSLDRELERQRFEWSLITDYVLVADDARAVRQRLELLADAGLLDRRDSLFLAADSMSRGQGLRDGLETSWAVGGILDALAAFHSTRQRFPLTLSELNTTAGIGPQMTRLGGYSVRYRPEGDDDFSLRYLDPTGRVRTHTASDRSQGGN